VSVRKWADATPGNLLALKSGEWSPRFVDPLAADLVAAISPTVTWWQECDAPAIWRWAQAEARHQLRVEYLADHRDDMTDDEVRAQELHLDKLAGTAERLGSKLGLDPLSRARLGRDVAAGQVDLARLWAAEDQDTTDGVRGPENGSERPEMDA
jgi:hypothetical protein